MASQALSRSQIIIMAVTAGVSVANIYYNQPILAAIASSFNVSESSVGAVSVLAQAGYGIGMFFIVPLGDKINRKTLIMVMQAILIAALIGMAIIPALNGIYFMSLLIGMVGVTAQVILPMAASLDTVNRGRTVGTIFTGLLIGILGARVFSGFIAEWLGWRYVYGISALMIIANLLVVKIFLPDAHVHFSGNYLQLLKSVIIQLKRFALLRRTALLGALVFGAFCSFWTTLTFYLSGPVFGFRSNTIGLFGLLAIAGALMAPMFGKIVDKGNPARSQLMAVSLLIASVLVMKFFPTQIMAFVIGVLLLDVGVQATQVTNVASIYTLDEKAHSRINTIYMSIYFLGGAIGSFAGVKCWKAGGWPAVTWQLLLWSTLALVVALSGYKTFHKAVQQTSL